MAFCGCWDVREAMRFRSAPMVPTDVGEVKAPVRRRLEEVGIHRLEDGILEALERSECGRLTFTGHSLGGTVAQLASLEILKGPNETQRMSVTFGSPRFAGPAVKDLLARRSDCGGPLNLRVVLSDDLVPEMYPDSRLVHCGQLLKVHAEPLVHPEWTGPLGRTILNHSMRRYAKSVALCLL